MNIAIGSTSTNPVKLNAVKAAVEKFYPTEKHQLRFVNVKSGVSDQPLTDVEAIAGAKRRASQSQKRIKSDLGFGLEGGTVEIEKIVFLQGWVAIYGDGKYSLASSIKIELPSVIAGEVLEGKEELGDIADRHFKPPPLFSARPPVKETPRH